MTTTTQRTIADPVGWRLERTYTTLPAPLHSPVAAGPVRDPRVVLLNRALATELGLDLDAVDEPALARTLCGQTPPPGAEPIAQAYAGHQYGHFTMLGDGRALLLGEQRTPSGALMDVQLKGSGRTPYSRGGDGLAALGPMLREYLISEAISALGIPSTRSLAVLSTGEAVHREGVQRGAILVRVASSHLRVGTFQFASGCDGNSGPERTSAAIPAILPSLAEFAIARHMPEIAASDGSLAERARRFLDAVIERQAALVAKWQMVGFVHGVMNTDNMSIAGETIDYGPCAFMDAYDPATVFSSIDHGGRYAYGEQPRVAFWNLARFAEALLPLIDDDNDRAVALATTALEQFPRHFERQWLDGMRGKLGLTTAEDDDPALIRDLLEWMRENRRDFTNTFRILSAPVDDEMVAAGGDAFVTWHARWRDRITRQGTPIERVHEAMRRTNPAVIPRNHRVEAALAAAEAEDDLAPLRELLRVVTSPFELAESDAHFAEPPPVEFCRGFRTFCGT